MKSVYHGSESSSFLGRKIWDILPDDYEDIDNLNTFKNKIKKIGPWKLSLFCVFFISDLGHAPVLKVAGIFKVFGAQSCLMVA